MYTRVLLHRHRSPAWMNYQSLSQISAKGSVTVAVVEVAAKGGVVAVAEAAAVEGVAAKGGAAAAGRVGRVVATGREVAKGRDAAAAVAAFEVVVAAGVVVDEVAVAVVVAVAVAENGARSLCFRSTCQAPLASPRCSFVSSDPCQSGSAYTYGGQSHVGMHDRLLVVVKQCNVTWLVFQPFK
jgi:hypothetical protein